MLKRVSMISLLVVSMATTLLYAEGGVEYQQVRRLTESGKIVPLTELLRIIQREKPGRVIEVELERKGQAYLYEIEILDEKGVVWEYKLNAINGEILQREQED